MLRITSVFDNSGYGFAARQTSNLLINAGIDISTNIIQTPMSRYEFSQDAEFTEIIKRSRTRKPYAINLAITIPSLAHYAFEKGKRNFLYFFWESDKICNQWIDI